MNFSYFRVINKVRSKYAKITIFPILTLWQEELLMGIKFYNHPNMINFEKINSIISEDTMILIVDIEGYIIYLNDKCAESFNYQPDELIGLHTRTLSTGFHSKEFYRNLWETALAGDLWRNEITDRRKDGSIAWHFMSVFPILDENKQPYQFLTLRTDISEQKEMERRALLIEKQLNSHFEITNDVMGCLDQHGNILYVNTAYERILGYRAIEAVGSKILDIIDQNDIPKAKKLFTELREINGHARTIELHLKSKNNTLITSEVILKNSLHDPMIKGIVFNIRDITEQKKIAHEIKQFSDLDYLTELPNRKAFGRKIAEGILRYDETKSPFAVLLLDIDEFRYINDSFGHGIGDHLLKKLTARMGKILNKNTFMARIGGDEFALIIENASDTETLVSIASLLITRINEEPFEVQEHQLFLSVSVGISVFPYSGESRETLVKNAEIAMYQAKKNGKNQYQIFSSTMGIDNYKEFTLRNDSRKALINDEFCFHFRPRINPLTNELMSAEALIRWNHPQWGTILPEEFMPLLEESNLIVPIGDWMLRKICYQIKAWEKEKLKVKRISIKLPTQHLSDPNFVDIVASILKETGINPQWLEFEIKEAAMEENEQRTLEPITKLRELGISFSLDDFGIGYSSLINFRKFHCDTIKIDKRLIKDIHEDVETYEIIETVVNLCHKMKRTVVIDGVDKLEQLTLLKELHCGELQGNFYSEPIDVLAYSELLRVGKWSLDVEETAPIVNRRKYFRVPFVLPLLADMTIERIGIRKLNIGSTEVLIHNLSPGGLCFQSSLRMPAKHDILLQFNSEILGDFIQVTGQIVWMKELENDEYKYGVSFILDDAGTERLIKVLNQLQIQLKRRLILPNSRFLTK